MKYLYTYVENQQHFYMYKYLGSRCKIQPSQQHLTAHADGLEICHVIIARLTADANLIAATSHNTSIAYTKRFQHALGMATWARFSRLRHDRRLWIHELGPRDLHGGR